MKKAVISRDVGIVDVENFVNTFAKKAIKTSDVEEKYLDILEAVEDGLLTFNESYVPKLTLKTPIKNTDGEVSLSEINFKTRIKPTDLANIGKGLNLATDTLNMQLRMVANICGQPIAFLDLLSKYDYDVVSSVASVFT